MFKGFKPQGMQKIATRMGYAGSMDKFDDYLKQNPDKEREMIVYRSKAQEMAKGGVVKLQTGGVTPITQPDPRGLPQQNIPQLDVPTDSTIGQVSSQQAITPALPTGGTTVPVGTQLTQEQMLAPTSGQVSGTVSVPTAMAQTTMAEQPTATTANVMDAQGVAEQVNTSLDTLQAAQTNTTDPRTQVLAAQQTATSVGNLNSAQGNATLLQNPVQRQIPVSYTHLTLPTN